LLSCPVLSLCFALGNCQSILCPVSVLSLDLVGVASSLFLCFLETQGSVRSTTQTSTGQAIHIVCVFPGRFDCPPFDICVFSLFCAVALRLFHPGVFCQEKTQYKRQNSNGLTSAPGKTSRVPRRCCWTRVLPLPVCWAGMRADVRDLWPGERRLSNSQVQAHNKVTRSLPPSNTQTQGETTLQRRH
jgi:hypothetical protein